MMKLPPLWQEIWDALAWGKPAKDADPIHRFNRLVKEHFPSINLWLDQSSCIAENISLTSAQIKQLTPWHTRANPNKVDGKIIVFKYKDESAIIDGNNRVALYLLDGHKHDIEAILVELCQ